MKEIEVAVRELGGVWPSDDVEAVYLYKIDNRHIAGLPGGTALHICTRTEFEECTRRLRNEPRWVDAPFWAVAKAQDSDGEWYWYKQVPCHGAKYWRIDGAGKSQLVCEGEVIGDWKTTLRLRPEEKKVENKNEWHKRGELPPVGTVCEVFPYWHVCESIAPHQNGMVMHDRNNYEYFLATKNTRFRPLQTERERWVKEMCRHLHEDGVVSKTWLQRCYDAGLAKMPEYK